MKIKIFTIAMMASILSACGNGDSDSSSKPVTLNDIVGVWNDTTTSGNGKKDIKYFEIKANSTYKGYDYQNDTFDNGSDCYEVVTGSIVDQGNGKFIVDGKSNVRFTIQGNSMTYAFIENNKEVKITVYKTNKTASDLKPLCK